MSCRIDHCNLLECVADIQGLNPTSTSPSDQWLLRFRPGTQIVTDNFDLGTQQRIVEPIHTSFLKFFLTGSTLKIVHELLTNYVSQLKKREKDQTDIDDDLLDQLLRTTKHLVLDLGYLITDEDSKEEMATMNAVGYEAAFYLRITNPMLAANICPHFVKAYGVDHCDLSGFLRSIKKNEHPLLANQIRRSVLSLLTPKVPRQSLTASSSTIDDILVTLFSSVSGLEAQLSVSCLLTKDMRGADVLRVLLPQLTIRQVYLIFFQVVYACYALFLAGAIHNDLHAGNVFVSQLEFPRNVIYTVWDDQSPDAAPQSFVFKNVSLWARLYDFDNSSALMLHSNPKLDVLGFCSTYSMCHQPTQAWDLIRLLASISRDPVIRDMPVVDWFSKPDATSRAFWSRVVYEGDGFLGHPYRPGDAISRQEFIGQTLTYPQILKKLYDGYTEANYGIPRVGLNELVTEYSLDKRAVENTLQETSSVMANAIEAEM